MSTDQPAHVPQELRSWAADAFGSEYALSPIQLAIGGAVLDSVWSQGIAEGRRQATEGWEREWGAQYRDDSWVQATFDDRLAAEEFAAEAIGHRAVSRLVGPWEPEPVSLPEHPAIDEGQFQREILGMWPADQPEDGAR